MGVRRSHLPGPSPLRSIYRSQVSEALASGVSDIRLTPGNMQLNDLEFYAAIGFYPVEGKAAWSKCRRPVPRLAARAAGDAPLTHRSRTAHAPLTHRSRTAHAPLTHRSRAGGCPTRTGGAPQPRRPRRQLTLEATQGAAVSASQSR